MNLIEQIVFDLCILRNAKKFEKEYDIKIENIEVENNNVNIQGHVKKFVQYISTTFTITKEGLNEILDIDKLKNFYDKQ